MVIPKADIYRQCARATLLIVTDDDEKKFAEIAAEELEAAGHE